MSKPVQRSALSKTEARGTRLYYRAPRSATPFYYRAPRFARGLVVELIGFEPTTSGLQSPRSPN